jgi:hypothetical protein
MRINVLCIALCSVVLTALPNCIDLAPGANAKIKLAAHHEWIVDQVATGLQVEPSKDKHIFVVTAKADAKPGKSTLVFKSVGDKQAKIHTASFTIKVIKAPKAKVAKTVKAPHVKKASKTAPVAVVKTAPVVAKTAPAAKVA